MPSNKRERAAEEIARLGDDIYERTIRKRVESSHHGKVVAIDVDSGEYEIADNALFAARALMARVPEAEIWLARVGYRTLHRIGYRLSRATE